ncbi:MAG: HAD-IA family hydrolase [Phenylobacterium sp.]|jgi:putative hydrolase of the HAD superfamily|uniref:HAD-IA family hydrolase n=1 Tax=Phenylobacterium sp. TaxID=1871053 RepID=UPI001B78795F|nr:HAD-IA family hydrolase [Phenylobacterium sp.]MBP7649189.1 HAD-IA family hydrolase [Phenylobacterium sp.]MBP7817771.1 HAD-IA family hydrolase [Phenylobacterium sp.]MBP9230408.1 HAD-IA family hydrolase [Phenylobacterium sp.]MBP9754709.1 HAD-IA family hydrolase [Phenylobacterium sp.]
MAIEAVIWDFGGVFTSSPFEAFARYETENGVPKDLIRRVNSTNPDTNAWALFERNEIDTQGFDRLFLEESTALGHPIPGSHVLPLLSGSVRPRMVAALKACKAQFKVGCITNNMVSMHSPGADAPQRAAGAMGQIMPLFDHIIESSKAGVRKPDPKIYLMMCEALSVEPGACVYLDDLGINCKPAAALGMTAIKVVDVDQTLAQLAAATGLTFDEVAA